MKKILIILFTFLMSFLSCNADGINAAKLYEQKAGSVFFVKTQSGTGSGIVLSEDGTFVTCFHVIADANYINVKTNDGEEYKVTGYKYLNPTEDVAILTIKSKRKFLPFKAKDLNSVKVGDNIYSISNPIGLQFVFSSGMISQIDKTMIQFSAPASPGSSGGALFDGNGNLIGMITSQLNPSKAQNINFATPSKNFMSHINDKAKINSKNQKWYDFVGSKLSKNELKLFISYAEKNNDYSMIYKYTSHYQNESELSSEEYALLGSMGIVAYNEDLSLNEEMLKDISKWFALSINSGKYTELSAYGLFFASFLNLDRDALLLSYEYLKQYPKTCKTSLKFLKKAVACDKNNTEQFFEIYKDMYNYFIYLLKQNLED